MQKLKIIFFILINIVAFQFQFLGQQNTDSQISNNQGFSQGGNVYNGSGNGDQVGQSGGDGQVSQDGQSGQAGYGGQASYGGQDDQAGQSGQVNLSGQAGQSDQAGQSGNGGCQVGKKQSIVATCYKDTGVLSASGDTLSDDINSFSELSSGFKENGDPDYAGLGGLPYGAKVKITTQDGKSISAVKNDKGGATAQQMDIQQGAMGRLGLPCDGNHNVDVEVESCP